MRYAVALIAILALPACRKDEIKVEPPPKVVRVAVKELVTLPAELTRECYDEPAREQSYGEAKRLANLRHESLAECNARMKKIREAQPGKE